MVTENSFLRLIPDFPGKNGNWFFLLFFYGYVPFVDMHGLGRVKVPSQFDEKEPRSASMITSAEKLVFCRGGTLENKFKRGSLPPRAQLLNETVRWKPQGRSTDCPFPAMPPAETNHRRAARAHLGVSLEPTWGLILGLSWSRLAASTWGQLEAKLGLHLGANLGPIWGFILEPARGLILGLSWARFGASAWDQLGASLGLHLGPVLGPIWGLILGPAWGQLGASSRGGLEPDLGPHLGANLGPHRGAVLGPTWLNPCAIITPTGAAWRHLGAR